MGGEDTRFAEARLSLEGKTALREQRSPGRLEHRKPLNFTAIPCRRESGH
jgi:hypothetical protein